MVGGVAQGFLDVLFVEGDGVVLLLLLLLLGGGRGGGCFVWIVLGLVGIIGKWIVVMP